jgi:hypothetical protein
MPAKGKRWLFKLSRRRACHPKNMARKLVESTTHDVKLMRPLSDGIAMQRKRPSCTVYRRPIFSESSSRH